MLLTLAYIFQQLTNILPQIIENKSEDLTHQNLIRLDSTKKAVISR